MDIIGFGHGEFPTNRERKYGVRRSGLKRDADSTMMEKKVVVGGGRWAGLEMERGRSEWDEKRIRLFVASEQ